MIIKGDLADVETKYELLEILGSGGFGVVRKCRNKCTGELAAVKTITKDRVDQLENLQREIELLQEVHHPHIIELYDIYEDDTSIHLVTELCTGGELYDKVIEKAEGEEGHFHEDDAAIIIRDILDAIRYIHDELHIVHRDLKPENFLLKDETDDAPVKIIDFGLSRRDDAPFGVMSSRVGTPYYVAPEVLMQSYTYKCDIWSIGVIAYILLCGFAPFAGATDLETIHLVQTASLEFPSPEWDNISEVAKDFIQSLLQRDPLKRPTAAMALRHPWVAKHVVEPGVPIPRPFSNRITSSPRRSRTRSGNDNNNKNVEDVESKYNADFEEDENDGSKRISSDLRWDSTRRTAFQKFLASLKVQKAIVGATQILTPQEASYLGQVFHKVDRDQDGKLSVIDLEHAVSSPNFSNSVKQNLKQMKSHLAAHPQLSFDIRPFLGFLDRRAKSASTEDSK